MNERYKNYLRKIGIAGFLFFLIKGLLWLIFGTALIKWIKGLVITTALASIPFFISAQPENKFELKKRILSSNTQKPNLDHWLAKSSINRAFFCKIEDKYLFNNFTGLNFRLGSKNYTNELEYHKLNRPDLTDKY